MTNNKFKRKRSAATQPSVRTMPTVNFDGIAKALTIFIESDAFKAAEKDAAAIRAARC